MVKVRYLTFFDFNGRRAKLESHFEDMESAILELADTVRNQNSYDEKRVEALLGGYYLLDELLREGNLDVEFSFKKAQKKGLKNKDIFYDQAEMINNLIKLERSTLQ